MPRLRLDPRPLLLAALAVALYSAYVQSAPYHFDTALYLQAVRDAAAGGALVHPFPTRPLDTWAYFLADRLWGDRGTAVVSVIGVGLFAAVYYFAVRRFFGAATGAAATLLVLFTPATLITVTHLKEDLWAFLLLAASLLLLGTRAWRALLAGVAFGASLLLKEIPILALPLLLATIVLDAGGLARAGRTALVFLAGVVAAVLVVAPQQVQNLLALTSSYHTGQFLGPFSSLQPAGIRFWREGMLHLAWPHALALVSVVAAWRAPRADGGAAEASRRFAPLLWFLTGAAVWVFLTNMTVVRGRLFVATAFFFAPVIADGARAMIEWAAAWLARPAQSAAGRSAKRGAQGRAAARPDAAARAPAKRVPVEALLVAGAAVLGFAHFATVAPTLEYRRAYPPQAEFYRGLAKALPADALLLSFDEAVLARWFTGRECLAHPIDPDTVAYGAFAADLRARIARQPVYALHDFMSYDQGGVLRDRFPRDFRLTPAYTALGEDYHEMTYCPRMDDLLLQMRARLGACTIAGAGRKPLRLNDALTVEEASYELECSGQRVPVPVIEYRGVRTGLGSRTVYRVE